MHKHFKSFKETELNIFCKNFIQGNIIGDTVCFWKAQLPYKVKCCY